MTSDRGPVQAPVATASARVSITPWVAFGALYAALTIVYAWPQLAALSTTIAHDAGDPGLNAWILWWNSQALPLTERWWNAPIFYPVHGAFALSETLLTLSVLTTPLQWMGVGAVPAYNIGVIVSFPLCALAAHALAHRLTGRHDAALLAGLAFAFGANRASQLPHIQMLWSMWMPACLLALHKYLDTHERRYLALGGAAWVLNALSSGYFFVFFAVLAAVWMLWFPRRWSERIAIGLTLVAATAVAGPVLLGYREYQAALGLTRYPEEIDQFSADLTAYWATSSEAWLPKHWTIEPRAEGELYPGVVVLILTFAGSAVAWHRARLGRMTRVQVGLLVIGLLLGAAASWTYFHGGWRTFVLGLEVSLTRPGKAMFTALALVTAAVVIDHRTIAAWRRRSPHIFYVVAAVVMVLFSLGPVGKAFGTAFLYQAPYSWLMRLPGGDGMRVPARFGILAILCLAQAAAIGFARISRRLFLIPAGALALLVAADGWVFLFPVAAVSQVPGMTAGAGVRIPVLELPMTDPYSDVAAMLRATVHRHPLVNGFSGFGPAHYAPLQQALAETDPGAFDALTDSGPLIVAVDRARDEEHEQADYVAHMPGAEMFFQSPLGPVFRLPSRPRRTPSNDPPLQIAAVDANQNYVAIKRIVDGDLNTWWQSDEPQSAGDQISIAFAQPVVLTRVDLDLSTSTLDYPRKLRVEAADEGTPPVLVWEGRTAGAAILGALADFKRTPVRVDFPGASTPSRRFTLTTMERSRDRHWSIAEIHAYGRLK